MARNPVTVYFGMELRHARRAAGMSREEFGRLVCYSPSTVGAFETGRRFPQPGLIAAADKHLATGGRFARMYETLLTSQVFKDGFRPWTDVEREATSLWIYELTVVPGLLQTERYAQALMGQDDARVGSRLARQEILTRDEPAPPVLVTLLEERVLRTLVGDESVMREQLTHLVKASEQQVIQVVPHSTRNYLHLDGAFVIATVDGRELVFVDTPFRGLVATAAEVVLTMKRRWDVIRAQALSVDQSVEYLEEVIQNGHALA